VPQVLQLVLMLQKVREEKQQQQQLMKMPSLDLRLLIIQQDQYQLVIKKLTTTLV
jgi:hypothetical protein